MPSERSFAAAGRSGTASPGLSAGGAVPRRPRRLTTASVVPIVLAVLAAGFAYEALQDRSAMTSIVVASSFIPAGSPVVGADTRLVSVHASDRALARGLLAPSRLAGAWVASVALRAGEPITASEVTRPQSGPRLGEMSVAVPVAQADGGAIRSGDRVDVLASSGEGAYYVAQGLRVVAVAPTSAASGVLGGGEANYFVVVAVGKSQALRLTAALGAQGSGAGNDQLQVVRSTGERATRQVSYSTSGRRGSAGRARP
ncbi:MAG: hypothetical protein ACRDZX_01995 [Acidimicrobiales bacterium]